MAATRAELAKQLKDAKTRLAMTEGAYNQVCAEQREANEKISKLEKDVAEARRNHNADVATLMAEIRRERDSAALSKRVHLAALHASFDELEYKGQMSEWSHPDGGKIAIRTRIGGGDMAWALAADKKP